jgi:hypothetical protein
METITIQIQVPKETQELFNGLTKIVKAIKVSMEDGWDIATDLPVIITQALVELAPMIQGIDQLPAEFKADPSAFIKSAVISAGDIAGIFLKKDDTI